MRMLRHRLIAVLFVTALPVRISVPWLSRPAPLVVTAVRPLVIVNPLIVAVTPVLT